MKQLVIPAAMVIAASMSTASAQTANWSGPYIGGHLGYAFGKSDVDVTLGNDWLVENPVLQRDVTNGWSSTLTPKGLVFGVQAGYNHQASNNVVLGVEVGATGLSADESKRRRTVYSVMGALTYDSQTKIDVEQMYTLRARAGITQGRTLFYATAGWAWARADMDFEVLSSGGYSKAGGGTKTLDGYTLGLGVEHRISSQLSLRADYSYTDLGRASYYTAYRPGSTFMPPGFNYSERFRQDFNLHQINIGLNYSF